MVNVLSLLCEYGAEHLQLGVPPVQDEVGHSSGAMWGGFLDMPLVDSKLQRSCRPA